MVSPVRVGLGVDVHAFTDDPLRELWLGGVRWPGERALAGHSDADVIAHAACNALLSAAGLGDLGSTFGVDRPEWAGASGADLLGETTRMVRAEGFRIENIAVQVICTRPKIGSRRREMEEVLSDITGAPLSISAATTDGLGFTGRHEGAMGVATALVRRTGRRVGERRRWLATRQSPMTTTLQRRARARLRSKSTK